LQAAQIVLGKRCHIVPSLCKRMKARVNQHPPVHHEGWMVSAQDIILCWVRVPSLTMVVSSVAFFTTYHKQVVSR